jgi:Holliday junction resolvasome RuvABC endonuclease subunit
MASATVILALDCATKTGWCLMKDGKVFESGVQDFSKSRGESNGAMFLRFRQWLHMMMDGLGWEREVHLVIYEAAHHRGGAATEIAVNMTGRVQELAEEAHIPFASVHTGTLKKFATGNGAASKEDMVRQAAIMLGRQPIDDNEADAVHLAAYAFSQYGDPKRKVEAIL